MKTSRDTDAASAPFAMTTESLEAMTAAISQAAQRSRGLMETGMQAWRAEAERFFGEMAEHSRLTMDDFAACQSPLDVLAVEQAWLQQRAKAYMDAGLRISQAMAGLATPETAEKGKPAR